MFPTFFPQRSHWSHCAGSHAGVAIWRSSKLDDSSKYIKMTGYSVHNATSKYKELNLKHLHNLFNFPNFV